MRKVDTVNGSEGKKKGKKKTTTLHFYADPESQRGRQVAKKKGKKKATTPAFMLVRKVNTRGVAALRGPGGPGPPNNLANSQKKIYIYAVAWGGADGVRVPPIILTLLRLWTRSTGRQKKRTRKRQLVLLRWSGKSTRSTGSQKKKDKKKTTRAFTLIRKVNAVDGSPKKRTRKIQQLALLCWLIGSGNSEFFSFEVLNNRWK